MSHHYTCQGCGAPVFPPRSGITHRGHVDHTRNAVCLSAAFARVDGPPPPWELPLRGLRPVPSYPCACGHPLADHTPEPRTACQVAACPCGAYQLPAARSVSAPTAATWVSPARQSIHHAEALRAGHSATRTRAETWARVNAYHDRLNPAMPADDDDTGAWLGWLAVVLVCAVLGAGMYLAFGGWRW